MANDRREQLDEQELRAWQAFMYAHAAIVPALDRELAVAHGLTLNQFEVLGWLARAGRRGLRMSDLSSRVVQSPSGVTRAVDQLEGTGLVERCAFEGDRRGSLATLTAEGRALFRRAANDHALGIREHFLTHMGRTELEQLTAALEKVLDGEGSPLPPLTTS
jgi:DNA-binding MarR family transcriptional regulator